MSEVVESPCVHVCVLDENDVCIGCYRTSDEIMSWSSMSVEDQQVIVTRVNAVV
jgi:predicted Fe-S protein YdhL (DUF1289 family)